MQDIRGKKLKQSVVWKRGYDDNKVQVILVPVVKQEDKTLNHNDNKNGANEVADSNKSCYDCNNSKLPATQASDGSIE